MLYELAVPMLSGISICALGAAMVMARQARKAPLQARLRALQAGGGGGTVTLGNPQLVGLLEQAGKIMTFGQTSTGLREELAKAGFHNHAAPTIYLGAKLLLLALGVPLCGALLLLVDVPTVTRVILVAAGGGLCFFLPNLDVHMCREKRRAEVRTHLPDAIDLLEICVSAGMGLDMAWNAVTDEVRTVSPVLADEMALTDLEIHLGASRAVAMRHMAERTGSDDLASLVAILVQSDRFGTSIAEALRTFATSMREARSQRAQEQAEKMAIKLIFPMVLFIFPAVVIVMIGPAVMSLGRALAGR